MVQFIKFLVKILDVYIGETGSCFNTRLSKHKRDLKLINLANLKEDDLNKKLALVKHCFNCEHRLWKF